MLLASCHRRSPGSMCLVRKVSQGQHYFRAALSQALPLRSTALGFERCGASRWPGALWHMRTRCSSAANRPLSASERGSRSGSDACTPSAPRSAWSPTTRPPTHCRRRTAMSTSSKPLATMPSASASAAGAVPMMTRSTRRRGAARALPAAREASAARRPRRTQQSSFFARPRPARPTRRGHSAMRATGHTPSSWKASQGSLVSCLQGRTGRCSTKWPSTESSHRCTCRTTRSSCSPSSRPLSRAERGTSASAERSAKRWTPCCEETLWAAS